MVSIRAPLHAILIIVFCLTAGPSTPARAGSPSGGSRSGGSRDHSGPTAGRQVIGRGSVLASSLRAASVGGWSLARSQSNSRRLLSNLAAGALLVSLLPGQPMQAGVLFERRDEQPDLPERFADFIERLTSNAPELCTQLTPGSQLPFPLHNPETLAAKDADGLCSLARADRSAHTDCTHVFLLRDALVCMQVRAASGALAENSDDDDGTPAVIVDRILSAPLANRLDNEAVDEARLALLRMNNPAVPAHAIRCDGAHERYVPRYSCFDGGVEVVTKDGLKPIRDVRPGDVLISYDHAHGHLVENKAVRIASKSGVTRSLTLPGSTAPILVTREHPFYLASSDHSPRLAAFDSNRYCPIGRVNNRHYFFAIETNDMRFPMQARFATQEAGSYPSSFDSAFAKSPVFDLTVGEEHPNFFVKIPGLPRAILVHNKLAP